VIDANGYVVSGATQAYSAGTIVGVMQSHGTSVSIGAPSAYLWTADANGPIATMSKSRGATVGTHTVVQSGDVLGQTRYFGSDGTQFIQAAQIRADIDGTPGTNDMPGRLVFSTTADGASSPTERMRIDSAGRVGIGQVAPSAVPGATLYLNKSLTGGVVGVGATVSTSVLSDVTAVARGFSTDIGVQDAVFTLPSLQHYFATQGTKGASATLTDQSGFYVNTTLTGATSNYGFFSSIASGTNRFNFYANGTAANYFAGVSQFAAGTAALPGITQISDLNTGIYFPAADTLGFTTGGTERMRIDSAGNVGIGGTAGADSSLGILGTYKSSGTITRVVRINGTIPSATTGTARGFSSELSTEAAAFTLANLQHFYANQSTIGATSAVTNQYGFIAESTLTGATANFGFLSNIAAAVNRWNFYANGTAANLFSGVSQFAAGTAALPGITQISDLNTGIFFPAADTLGFTTGGTERVRIDSSGNVGIGGTSGAEKFK
jgi:hypothetical protein